MLTETSEVKDAAACKANLAGLAARQLDAVRRLVDRAERPLAIVGGSGWSDEACRDLVAFAEANGLPVACSFRRQDVFDNRSERFVGDLGTSGPPALVRRVKEADVLLVVGARLGEMTTQAYSILDAPTPRQRLIHIHSGAEELGRVFVPELAINAPPAAFAAAVADAVWFPPQRFAAWREAARSDYLAAIEPPSRIGAFDSAHAMRALRDELPDDFILTLDAGNHTGWPQRYLQFSRPARQIGSTAGAMGYGVPAAVCASLLCPDRLVVGCVGDGGFMMSGQEIATAVQHDGRPIILLFNNESYGTIRMHQERRYPERVVGTNLVNPDFVAMAAAMGAYAERVTATEEFIPAFRRATESGRPAVLELRTDPEQVSTRQTLTSLRELARQVRGGAG